MVDTSGQLSPELISTNALKVVNRLTSHGYQAYLVGGCVRDLLLGKAPKDFDVATDAHPEEVRDLFRNSRLIGRRFRIVHVRFGREIIEVATFRAPHNEEQTEKHFNEDGRILSDNIYGTLAEDVHRRDFAMNALYYQPELDIIHDEVGGLDDIKQQRIRLIGEPESRFREDPVRMLRALRFKASMDFDIEPNTEAALRKLAHLLKDIPPARLFEEVLKLLMNGKGEASYREMVDYGVLNWLFPDTWRLLENTPQRELARLALASTDARVAEDKPVTPAFIFAALLWYPFVKARDDLLAEGLPEAIAAQEAASETIARQLSFTSIPKRFSGPMREIWNLQSRLPLRSGRRAEALVNHKRFRAAYDFLLLREAAGEDLGELGDWWTRYQQADAATRREMAQAVPGARKQRKRRRSKRSANRRES